MSEDLREISEYVKRSFHRAKELTEHFDEHEYEVNHLLWSSQ